MKAKLKLKTDYSSVDAVFDEGLFAVWGYPTIGISCDLESGGVEADADLAKQLSDKLKNELVGKKITLMSFDITQFSVSSLAIKPTVDIYMILELNAEGKIKAKFSYSDTRIYFKAQNYKSSLNDNKLICEVQKWGTTDFSIEAKMEASATLGIGVGLKFNFPAFEYKKGEKSYFGIFSDVSYEGQIIAKGGWGLNGSLQCKDYGYSLKPYWKTYGEARLGIFRNKLLSIDIQPDITAKELTILPLIEKSYNFCENQPSIPKDGLVAYYPFNGNANDESGNGNNGTVNGASLTTDRNGNANKAYEFGGINNPNNIKILSSSSLDFNNEATYSFFVKLNSEVGMDGYANSASSGIHCIFAKSHDRNGYVSTMSSGVIGTSISVAGFSGFYCSLNNLLPQTNLNHWYHIVYVFNNGENKIYVDGQLKGITSSGIVSIGNGQDLYFGKYSDFYYPLDGKIDDIRIYNRALTDSEVQKLYKL